MQIKTTKIFAIVFAAIFMIGGLAFAGSTTTNPTLVLTDSATPVAKEINNFYIQELGNAGLGDGYFRLVIPSDVSLQQCGSSTASAGAAIARTTTVLGTSASPKPLYVDDIAATNGVIFLGGTIGSNYGIMRIYASGGSGLAVYGSADANANGGYFVKIAKWSDLAAISALDGAGSSAKVGEIYYDDTTNETVITLAGIDSSITNSEKIWFNDINLKPATASATGSVNLSTLDKNADGTNGIGVTDDTTVKVLTMTDQPMYIAGSATGVTPPTIPAGKVAGQPNGRVLMTFVGAAANNNNVITVTLDNGAKFHATADTDILDDDDANGVQIAGTQWGSWATTHTSASLAVNSSGALVITLGTMDIADAATVTIPASSLAVIDTSGVTASGDINAAVTGAGTDLATLNQSAKIAAVSLTGTTVSFSDDSTAGFTTIYAGRTAQTIGESLLIGESAPASLLAGGLIQLDLDLGAKFTASDALTDTEYTTSPYADSALALSLPAAAATASATYQGSVSVASSTNRGAYKVGSFSFNLGAATPGNLMMTVSGNAGASGVVTMATIVNATATTVSSVPTLIPGSASVTLPDIVITEAKAGALGTAATKDIVIHFPSTITLDQTATITVKAVSAVSGAARWTGRKSPHSRTREG